MIETNRLILKPLTYQQLQKYCTNDTSLELELELQPIPREISLELKEALEQVILPAVADTSKNYLYYTLWTIILKKSNQLVGDLCFVGEPTPEGEVEIGYGTYEPFRKRGYMTEAVQGMLTWVRQQPLLTTVIASTNKDNIASHSVLEKNNFHKIDENETLFYWQLLIT